ncbi:MAG: hypothetical protein HUK14_04255 [Muribaculaceae bacterium]|nr:hypothetical protein [Muribaculaceae bacterium]
MKKSAQNLKATLILGDITERSTRASRDNSLTVLRYAMDCARVRQANGIPYERSETATISLTLKALDNDSCRVFYSWLVDKQRHTFSLLFNALYGPHKHLNTWDAGMVVDAYLVDIDEDFKSHHETPDEIQQIAITLKFILLKVRFLGENDEKQLDISY